MGTLAKSTKADRFSQLHAAHAAYLARRIHSLQPWIPPSLHADVLQEVWEVVHRRIEDVPHDDLERPWLVKVVRFKLLHHARSHVRARRKEDALTPVTAMQGEDGAQFESREMIRQILDALPEEQREVVVRIEMFGESANEVAEHVNIPPNTVYGRLRLARARISRMGITIVVVFAWLRANARDALTRSSLAAFAGGFALGMTLAGDVSPPPPESDSNRTGVEQPAVAPTAGSGREPEALPGQPLVAPVMPPLPLVPVEPETPAPAEPLPQLGPAPDGGLPVSDEPAPGAPTTRKAHRNSQPRNSQQFLRRIDRALKQGKGREALSFIKKHRKKFPGHEQTHIVAAYEIEALCLLGRNDEARAAYTVALTKYAVLPIHIKERRNKCW